MLSPVIHVHIAEAAHQQLGKRESRIVNGAQRECQRNHTQRGGLSQGQHADLSSQKQMQGIRGPHFTCHGTPETASVTRGPSLMPVQTTLPAGNGNSRLIVFPPSRSNLSTVLIDFLMLHLYLITLAVSPSERLFVSIFDTISLPTKEFVCYDSKTLSRPNQSTRGEGKLPICPVTPKHVLMEADLF